VAASRVAAKASGNDLGSRNLRIIAPFFYPNSATGSSQPTVNSSLNTTPWTL